MNIRIRRSVKELIDRAAKAVGKNRTEFIIAAAHREAVSVLLDQRLFTLDGAKFKAFKAALDRPPADNLVFRQLLDAPAPWDQ